MFSALSDLIRKPQSPNLAAQNWEEFTKTNPLFPKGPHHSLLAAHFGTPRVLLTHSELCPSAQEELGGLGDGAVVGAAVWGLQVADVQAVGAVGPRLTDTKLVLAHICAVDGFAKCVGKHQELKMLPLLAPAVPVQPSSLLQVTEDFSFVASLG